MTRIARPAAAASRSDRAGAASLFSNHPPQPSLKDPVGKFAPTPLLLIYGEHGQDGERNLNPTYYKAAGQRKAIWEVPGQRACQRD